MDILGALPLELSIRILKCLTPAESIRLRLVSKSYHDLLISEEVCSSLSHHFIKREYNAAKKFDSWRLHYENHISRRLSYGFGKPWKIEVLHHMWFRSFCPETSYLAGTLETDFDFVQVLDLNTYPAEHVLPPTRTPDSSDIRDVVLLPSFVVVVTWTNRGYSWNLETHRLYVFEVPDWADSDPAYIFGNGNLIVVPLRDSVIVHDVQAEKASELKGIRDETRIWNGVETVCRDGAFAIANAERRVVWVIRELQGQVSFDQQPFAIDSFRLETGEVVPEVRSIVNCGLFYCGDGLWQFWGDEPFSCHPEPAQDTTNVQAKRIALDTGTGAWTEEAYTIMFPGWVTKFHRRDFHSGPMTRSDGLGCFIESDPRWQIWMLDQEPGDRVTRAHPLDLSALAGRSVLEDLRATEGGSIDNCLGLSDKFVLLADAVKETVVVRFKGIHDSDR